MRVLVSTTLDCAPEKAWAAVQTSALFQRVAWPLVSIRALPGETLPETWREGATVHCRMRILGVSAGVHTLGFELIDQAARDLQSRESDALVRRWDHLISIRPAPGGKTRYSDEIDIDAGLLTPFVYAFAQVFYRHRQRRWRKLAPAL
jgi:hypothetical protein